MPRLPDAGGDFEASLLVIDSLWSSGQIKVDGDIRRRSAGQGRAAGHGVELGREHVQPPEAGLIIAIDEQRWRQGIWPDGERRQVDEVRRSIKASALRLRFGGRKIIDRCTRARACKR
jgi:hypothetical protein